MRIKLPNSGEIMGGNLSMLQEYHKRDLLFLLKPAGDHKNIAPLIEKMLEVIAKLCPLFLEQGSFDLEKWNKIGAVLRSHETPAQILHIWQICRDEVAKVTNPLLQLPENHGSVIIMAPLPTIMLPEIALPKSEINLSCCLANSLEKSSQKIVQEEIAEIRAEESSEPILDPLSLPVEKSVLQLVSPTSNEATQKKAVSQNVSACFSILTIKEQKILESLPLAVCESKVDERSLLSCSSTSDLNAVKSCEISNVNLGSFQSTALSNLLDVCNSAEKLTPSSMQSFSISVQKAGSCSESLQEATRFFDKVKGRDLLPSSHELHDPNLPRIVKKLQKTCVVGSSFNCSAKVVRKSEQPRLGMVLKMAEKVFSFDPGKV